MTLSPRDAELMFELGTLRHVERTWRQFGGLPYANTAEHSFRTAWIAWLIATKEGADVGKVLRLALIHDTAETRTGDVNYLSRMYTERHDGLAIGDQFADTALEQEAAELWAEYEARETLESRVVKDADTIDCDLELQESRATGPSLYPVLRPTRDAAFAKLYTATARELFETLYASDAHAWHVAGRNRATTGDWAAAPDETDAAPS